MRLDTVPSIEGIKATQWQYADSHSGDSVKVEGAAMLIPCLWTTLPWIVLGQTYYLSFFFNNYGYGARPIQPNMGFPGAKKPLKRVEDTLELSSMDQSQGSGQNSKPIFNVDDLSSDSSDGLDLYTTKVSNSNRPTKLRPTVKRSTVKPSKATTTQATSRTPETSRTTKTTQSPGILETADSLETPKEVTTKSNKATEMNKGSEETTSKAPDTGHVTPSTGDVTSDGKTLAPVTVAPRVWKATWPPVTPHPPESFEYPEADCHEEMDLHEVFGISLERDRGLPTKVVCQFKNSWGGPWLLMTRVELPVRIHMRHWFLGYVTEDYKDMNINFLALAHIMNHMRTAMLILGQDANDQLVYNLYDDVVISSFNDVFMMRRAELVEANTTDMLFLAVGKTLSSYAGRNRSCPLQVLGSWWGNTVKENMYEGFSCVFPRDRSVTRPGYMAIFIKPSLFRSNNTALYNSMITTRRPWGLTVAAGLMEEVKNNKTEYDNRLEQQFRRTKQIVQKELERRAGIFDAIEKLRRLQKGR